MNSSCPINYYFAWERLVEKQSINTVRLLPCLIVTKPENGLFPFYINFDAKKNAQPIYEAARYTSKSHMWLACCGLVTHEI